MSTHLGAQRFVKDLNQTYRNEPALYELDCDPAGFEWGDANEAEASVVSLLRKSRSGDMVMVVCNFTPVAREGYGFGVPWGGWWRELLNSNAVEYGARATATAAGSMRFR